MTHNPLSHLSATDPKLAGLGPNHGYRFEADQVYMNGMFAVLDSAANSLPWQLQLWAYPVGAPLNSPAFLVAAAILPPLVEIADESESFEVNALATPPPGSEEYSMVLALVCVQDDKQVTHDFAVLPVTQKFVQPQMIGNIGFHVEGSNVHLSVEQIRNPRPLDTQSGTLALELWALPAPYFGGAFQGFPIAGIQIAPLPGQWESINNFYELPYSEPKEGTWYFVIMLREWTPAGFVTRDSTSFLTPVTIAPRPALTENRKVEAKPKTVEKKATSAKPEAKKTGTEAKKPSAVAAEKPKTETKSASAPEPTKIVANVEKSAPASAAATTDVKAEKPIAVPTPAPTVAKVEKPAAAPAPVKEVKPKAKAKPKAAPKSKTAPTVTKEIPAVPVSVNSATPAQLAGIKGMPAKVADAVIAARPFASLDDLAKIKDFGQPLLDKLRPFLKL